MPIHYPGMGAKEARERRRMAQSTSTVDVLLEGVAGGKPLADALARVASTPRTTVLVSGEAGSGKGRVAAHLHAASARRNGPLVQIDCRGQVPQLLEIQLFGTVEAPGLLEEARGGTLVLGEVGALSRDAQNRLAGVLAAGSWRPFGHGGGHGGAEEALLDVRLVATTSLDLETEVEANRFHGDLYYRLNVLHLDVPPLRERPEDVLPLFQRALKTACKQLKRELPNLGEGARTRLEGHPWRGNLTELEAVAERAALHAGGTIGEELLDLDGSRIQAQGSANTDFVESADSLPLGDRSLAGVEKALIQRVLEETGGNRSLAARTLGVHRQTLYNKLRQYSL